MERVLSAAGVSPAILSQIPAVLDTCRECRAWQKPGPDPSPTVELATRQDEYIEADIMFYKEHMIWHMIDRADRLHAATEITSKAATSLCEAIETTWVTILGTFKYLVVDGEKGLFTPEAEEY